MRLPYVSRATFEAACARADEAFRECHVLHDRIDTAQENARYFEREVFGAHTQWAARYEALLEKYHALRSQGFAPIDAHAFPVTDSPLSKLGPLTRAALEANAKGLSRANRAAMENAALSMYAQQLPDDAIAQAVRQGETLRKVG